MVTNTNQQCIKCNHFYWTKLNPMKGLYEKTIIATTTTKLSRPHFYIVFQRAYPHFIHYTFMDGSVFASETFIYHYTFNFRVHKSYIWIVERKDVVDRIGFSLTLWNKGKPVHVYLMMRSLGIWYSFTGHRAKEKNKL